jgi:hypothetical protein
MPAGGSSAMRATGPLDSGDPWARGCVGEAAVCRVLGGLGFAGYRHIDDRRWPGSTNANVDHVVVGPTGVFIVDAKNWTGALSVRGHSIYQNDRCRDDNVVRLSRLAVAVDEFLATTRHPILRSVPVICFAGSAPVDQPALGRVLLSDVTSIRDVLTRRSRTLDRAAIDEIFEFLRLALPPYDIDDAAVDALFEFEESRLTGMTRALRAPIEDWIVYLHPEQAPLVRRSFSGPARVSGPAGTGKTAVGLHRLAWLAGTRPGRMLWTSYVRTLPLTMREAYRKLAPETTDRVDFVHVHKIATDLLRSRGIVYKLDWRLANSAFRTAWARCGDGLSLDQTGCSQEYYREEIQSVIKGRGLETLNEYLAIRRTGRRTAFNAARREAVWNLAVVYDDELAARGVVDFDDIIVLARNELRVRPEPRYSAIIADEVQDLTLAAVQVLRLLMVGGADKPDGLLLIGDGQQAIYAGGWSLGEAGFSVAGRGAVLRHNHRNTIEIVAAAGAFLVDDTFDDLDADEQVAHRDVVVSRHGDEPADRKYRNQTSHDLGLISDLRGVMALDGVQAGDIALLFPTNALCERYGGLLGLNGIPFVRLSRWDGTPTGGVKVGTYHRAKGLEFKHVFMPRLEVKTQIYAGGGRDPDVRREKAEMARRHLFVAASRARDSLWKGRVAP